MSRVLYLCIGDGLHSLIPEQDRVFVNKILVSRFHVLQYSDSILIETPDICQKIKRRVILMIPKRPVPAVRDT